MLNLLVTIRNRDKKLYDNKLSGLWLDYKIQETEDVQRAILPMNEYTETIYYNRRFLIDSALFNSDSEPRAWLVSKVNRIAPKGMCTVTFAQDRFDQHHDYIEKDEEGSILGMWADYFQTPVAPEAVPEQTDLLTSITAKITWSFFINNEDASDLLSISYPADNKARVKFTGSEDYIGSTLTIIHTSEDDNVTASLNVGIIAY